MQLIWNRNIIILIHSAFSVFFFIFYIYFFIFLYLFILNVHLKIHFFSWQSILIKFYSKNIFFTKTTLFLYWNCFELLLLKFYVTLYYENFSEITLLYKIQFTCYKYKKDAVTLEIASYALFKIKELHIWNFLE